jgi:hypothetical protein
LKTLENATVMIVETGHATIHIAENLTLEGPCPKHVCFFRWQMATKNHVMHTACHKIAAARKITLVQTRCQNSPLTACHKIAAATKIALVQTHATRLYDNGF